jgi:hypothetical protein
VGGNPLKIVKQTGGIKQTGWNFCQKELLKSEQGLTQMIPILVFFQGVPLSLILKHFEAWKHAEKLLLTHSPPLFVFFRVCFSL